MLATTSQALELYLQLREIWRADPVLYMRQRFDRSPSKQQRQMLEAIAPTGAKVTVRAGHGVGKTGATACIIWWMMENFENCRVMATAPSATQLFTVLWAELGKWRQYADAQSEKTRLERPFWLSTLFTMNQRRIYDPSNPNNWFAMARTARKEQPDALQGVHASDVAVDENDVAVRQSDHGGSLLYVVEEASGVDDRVFETAEGALSDPGSRLLMVGNPVRNTGFFARSHNDPRSIGSYKRLHFPCSGSPFPAADYRANLVRRYGEGSNVVLVRADGEFPKQDDDVLIPLELTEAARTRELETFDADETGGVLGVDVARFGSDRTTMVYRCGRALVHIEVHAKQDTMVTVGQVINLIRRFKPVVVNVDVDGVGGGVVDRLTEQRYAQVNGVHAGETATLPSRAKTPSAERVPLERFGRQEMTPAIMKDHMWLEMLRWFQQDEPSLAHVDQDHAEVLAAELSTVKYAFDSAGRLRVEPKDKLKQRGLPSPDLADALALTFAPDRGIDLWARLGSMP